MNDLYAIILAAGEGKRMKSNKAKVIHKTCGKSLIEWVINSVEQSGASQTCVVVGYKSEQVIDIIGDKVSYAYQKEQLGTGHAVKQAEEFLGDKKGTVMVLCGDTPLITSETLLLAKDYHETNNNSVTVLTASVEEPFGYGRIIKNDTGNLIKIVEQKDATDQEKQVKEINSGMYFFNIEDLIISLNSLSNENSQSEYYLTDTIEILINEGKKAGSFCVKDNNEILGINNRIQLSEASDILRKRIINKHLENGVTFISPETSYIESDVVIGVDTIIYPGTIIEGKSIIGEECVIGPYSRIVCSEIDDKAVINNSVILESKVGSETKVGPFAYLRPKSVVGTKVKIGDFVEIKKSVIGDGTKISHLSYIGDAELGKNVNMGCGSVVVNYDGKKKHKTIVGDNVFVGCNANLVSPVNVEANSYIAAGSTITDNVPEYSLAIARKRQSIIENWVLKKGLERKG